MACLGMCRWRSTLILSSSDSRRELWVAETQTQAHGLEQQAQQKQDANHHAAQSKAAPLPATDSELIDRSSLQWPAHHLLLQRRLIR